MTDEITNQEQLSAWVKEQFQRANKYLAEQGILFESVVPQESRYLAPNVAVWKIKDTKKNFYWVISGNLPADALPLSVATTARSAIKHFSMSWHMKADSILSNPASDDVQKQYAALLISKAEMLFTVQEDEKWWQEG